MTIDEAKALAATLAASIQAQVREYQQTTGLFVHSIPVVQTGAIGATTVDVKVQLNNPK